MFFQRQNKSVSKNLYKLFKIKAKTEVSKSTEQYLQQFRKTENAKYGIKKNFIIQYVHVKILERFYDKISNGMIQTIL